MQLRYSPGYVKHHACRFPIIARPCFVQDGHKLLTLKDLRAGICFVTGNAQDILR